MTDPKVEAALKMAGKTTWASHSREQVDAALSALATAYRELEKRHKAEVEAAYREGHEAGGCVNNLPADEDWLLSDARKRIDPA